MSRQVRINISDEAWMKVSAEAARRRMDRGALVDLVLMETSFVDLTPGNVAAGAGHITHVDGQPIKPPPEPPDAALPYRPAPKPRRRG